MRSRASVDSFLAFLESAGRVKQTIATYRRCLERLYVFLPGDKTVSADALRPMAGSDADGKKVRQVAERPCFRRKFMAGIFGAKGNSFEGAPV